MATRRSYSKSFKMETEGIEGIPGSSKIDQRCKEATVANEQYAFLERSGVPNRAAWQDAIDKCGFDFQLDPELKSFEASGFLPCKLMGREAGFEIYYDGSAEMRERSRQIAPDKDYCVSFRWGGGMVACASVMIASYVLARYFDAVVSYEGEDPYQDLDTFLSDTNAIIKEAENES